MTNEEWVDDTLRKLNTDPFRVGARELLLGAIIDYNAATVKQHDRIKTKLEIRIQELTSQFSALTQAHQRLDEINARHVLNAIEIAGQFADLRAAADASVVLQEHILEALGWELNVDSGGCEGTVFRRKDWRTTTEPISYAYTIKEIIDVHAQAHQQAVWPNIVAPAKYDNPAEGWEDSKLPDFSLIWRLAREVGYAVGIHGSLKRDVDLIAAPWTDEAVGNKALIDHLCAGLNAAMTSGPERKPCGRYAATLQIDGYYKPIDLSIMPRHIDLQAQLQQAVEALERLCDEVSSYTTERQYHSRDHASKDLDKREKALVAELNKALTVLATHKEKV